VGGLFLGRLRVVGVGDGLESSGKSGPPPPPGVGVGVGVDGGLVLPDGRAFVVLIPGVGLGVELELAFELFVLAESEQPSITNAPAPVAVASNIFLRERRQTPPFRLSASTCGSSAVSS
jgi:hypothetical protein